jgi:hypothetical protein
MPVEIWMAKNRVYDAVTSVQLIAHVNVDFLIQASVFLVKLQ